MTRNFLSDSKQPLRVLMVTARYFPFIGGIEAHVYEVCKRLARMGVATTILTTDPYGNLPRAQEQDGVEIRRVRAFPAREDFYFAPEVYRFVRQGQWDVIHCQGVHTFVPPLAMLACRHAQLPYVVTFHTGGHSSQVRNAARGLQWRVIDPLLRGAAGYVAVSKFEQAYFAERLEVPPGRIAYIPNGSDLPGIENPPPLNPDAPLIISIGRLERFKGHQRLIAAMPLILKSSPHARLMILGSGPYEAELRQQIQMLRMSEAVEIKMIPVEDRQTMANTLASASLVTLLSDAESNPVAIMEAVALGRPALVANTSGLRELAARGLAQAIPLESTPAQVADAVLAQLRQPKLPGRVELPTWDGCARDLLAVYRRVVQAQPTAVDPLLTTA